MLSFKRTSLPAFSLIEMSLVLAIMGTVAGLSLPMLLEQRTQQQSQQSLQHCDLVLTALGTYAAVNKVLPCPATNETSGEPALCTKENTTQAVGYVPYKVLGLPERASQDGFGHPLRYAVMPTLTHKEDAMRTIAGNKLNITDDQNRPVFDALNTKDCLAVVLVAEGPAFGQPASDFERKNISNTLSFVDAPFSSNPQRPFRHLVKWVTRNNLVTYYGKSSLPTAIQSPTQSVPQTGLTNPTGAERLGPGSAALAMDDADLGF